MAYRTGKMPQFRRGVDLITVGITLYTVGSDGTFSPDGSRTPMIGMLKDIEGPNVRYATTMIQSVDTFVHNFVPTGYETTMTLTEVLKSDTAVGNVLPAALYSGDKYALFDFTIGFTPYSEAFSFFGLMEENSYQVVREENVCKLTLVQVDNGSEFGLYDAITNPLFTVS